MRGANNWHTDCETSRDSDFAGVFARFPELNPNYVRLGRNAKAINGRCPQKQEPRRVDPVPLSETALFCAAGGRNADHSRPCLSDRDVDNAAKR